MTDHTNAGARSLVLGRVRDILGARTVDAATEYGAIAREYQQSAPLEEAARIELFVDRLQHYQVGVYRCERATLPRTIEQIRVDRDKSRLVIPRDLPREWLPPGLEAVEDTSLTYPELDRSDGVLTGCSIAIAATGTIVLCHGPIEGRRALTLVPDYHLCVVSEEQVVATVPEAIARLVQWKPPLVTTISGPSATADIEMMRIRGVHGPRTLDVVVVG